MLRIFSQSSCSEVLIPLNTNQICGHQVEEERWVPKESHSSKIIRRSKLINSLCIFTELINVSSLIQKCCSILNAWYYGPWRGSTPSTLPILSLHNHYFHIWLFTSANTTAVLHKQKNWVSVSKESIFINYEGST